MTGCTTTSTKPPLSSTSNIQALTSNQAPLPYRMTNFGMMASAEERNIRSSSSNDLTTIGDLDAFELAAGTFTSHANTALYGEESEDVANLSAIDGSKYE